MMTDAHAQPGCHTGSVIAPSDKPTQVWRVALVDDHKMVLEGLRSWLTASADDIVIEIAVASWGELLAHPAFPVDVVLLDLDLKDGIPAPFKIATLVSTGVRVVMVSTLAEPRLVRACLDAGALSYLPKIESAEEIVRGLRAAALGEPYLGQALAAALLASAADDEEAGGAIAPRLSPQELRVLVLYASGLPMKSVARSMKISFDTAKCYLDRVREKYAAAGREARTKIELHRRAVEDNLLQEV